MVFYITHTINAKYDIFAKLAKHLKTHGIIIIGLYPPEISMEES